MNINLLVLFLIAHILGDFYFQRNYLSTRNNKLKTIFIHSLLYQCLFLLLLLTIDYDINLLLAIIVIGASHFILEFVFFLIKNNKWIENNDFYVKQIIHIIVIYFCLIDLQNIDFNFSVNYLPYIMAFLLVDKPSNIMFKKIFTRFKPNDTKLNSNESYKKAGATIGSLERTLILICLINELYSSIGLILTAKSIARYNRISNEPEFSEYYLLGTLSSVFFTIIIYFLSFKLF